MNSHGSDAASTRLRPEVSMKQQTSRGRACQIERDSQQEQVQIDLRAGNVRLSPSDPT